MWRVFEMSQETDIKLQLQECLQDGATFTTHLLLDIVGDSIDAIIREKQATFDVKEDRHSHPEATAKRILEINTLYQTLGVIEYLQNKEVPSKLLGLPTTIKQLIDSLHSDYEALEASRLERYYEREN